MSKGICIVAEQEDRRITSAFSELMTAAIGIKRVTEEPIQVVLAGTDCASLLPQFDGYPIDEIYTVDLEEEGTFRDDMLAEIYADTLRRIAPGSVLIPASETCRSVFPRVAWRLKTGLTADCTGLDVEKRADGTWFIRQMKPSFEENSLVYISCKPGIYPQMMTLREGVCEAFAPGKTVTPPQVRSERSVGRDSAIRVIETVSREASEDDMRDAEIVFAAGRGTLDGENFDLLKKVADRLGAAVGGTRPLMDCGLVPFENQIGQTGSTIRPRIVVSFGVSGAIQHTEGIKNTNLFIAVNADGDAPIFGTADYGAVMKMEPVLEHLLKLLQ
ncbi:MAG: electron transfer flavoprotein subunit alpha/FixB family protein [Clostridiales Family XIII bacterium]|jgi:electron transfer flavoprotein alpha subunit|nr:electron transfer flavoprotein subunit alpha/FixB family protein [Clostridiales Family XIII bacterium]